MTIDEKIQDFRQLEYDFEHSMCDTEDEKENLVKYQQEWEYYKQLAEWLEELKMYKSLAPRELVSQKQRNDRNAEYHKGFNDGYNKAIDDFVEKAIEEQIQYDCPLDVHDIEEIAERLKAGGTDEMET